MPAKETVEVTLGTDAVLKTLELPVSDVPGRRLPAQSDTFGAGAAGVLSSASVNAAWRADAHGAAVEIWPLELAQARMPHHGARLRIEAPFPILPNCVAVSTTDTHVVVDFITDVGFLYTVLLQPLWLVDAGAAIPTPATFTRAFRPYNFDAAPPRLLRAVDATKIAVALADGTIICIDRASPLASPVQSPLAEHYSTGIGAGLAKVFRAGADRVPGRPDLALRAAIAMEPVGHNLVTYSVDGSVRLWSLKSSACVQVVSSPPQAPLRTRPASLLAVCGTHVLVADTDVLRVYKVEGNSLTPLSTGSATVDPELRSWFTTGLVLREDGAAIIAYKTNLSARIFVVQEGQWTQIGGYDLASYLDFPADASVQNVARRVLQSSDSVLRAALNQLSPERSRALGDRSITEPFVRDTIAQLATENDDRTQWLRLDTLCREIEVADAELLAVAPAAEAPESLGWTIRAASFTLISSDLGTGLLEDDNLEALNIANDLLRLVPEPTLRKISSRLLSPDMLLDRVDDTCELVRPHLDSKQLNEIGRQHAKQLASAIRRYAQIYAPDSTGEATPVAAAAAANSVTGANAVFANPVELSGLGSLAVIELIRNYAVQQSRAFLLLATMAVIGLVEGWFVDDGNAEPLRGTLACHQRLAFVAELDARSLQPEIHSAQLGHFGLQAARELTARIDPLSVLASMLLPAARESNRSVRARFDTLASIVESSVSAAELTMLRGLAALCVHEEQHGEELLRRVSLARKWPVTFGPQPTTGAQWFVCVAQYAKDVGAMGAALNLARVGSALASRDEGNGEGFNEVLELLYELSLGAGEIYTAYTALVRRFAQDTTGSEKWLGSFVDATARRIPEDASKVIATLPFVGLTAQLVRVLTDTPVFGSIPSYKLRYAWHVEHEDYAGAALTVYEHIQQRDAGDAFRKNALYTICLNALALQKHDARWLVHRNRVVTYDDIRSEYDALLESLAKTAASAA